MSQLELNSSSENNIQEIELRRELERELKNKRQCTYQPYECSQLCLDNYQYCMKHILNDKSAPFKQCSFTYNTNGKKCNLPAPRSDKKDFGYCSEHALKVTLTRNRQNSKHPLPCTAEVLLSSLSHYVYKPRNRNSSSSTHHSDDDRVTPDSELKSAKCLDPFVDIDASMVQSEKCSRILDVCSESESDIEPSTLSSIWPDIQADSSDDESIDSENEDLLKHANVYTAEEITLLARDKLIKLQSLYIEQYRYLQYLLTNKRRKYLHSLKREKETCCNIYNQVRDNPKEQRLYKKLKALYNYQKCHGTDAILSKRLRDLRVKLATDGASKSSFYSKCIFTEGGVKCGERSLPLAKHCQKHILEDNNQVLFRACGKMAADIECPTPIVAMDDATCPLHMDVPLLRSYGQIRKDSESDADDTADMNFNQTTSQMPENIKDEFITYEPPEIPKMESLPSMLFEETLQNVPTKPTSTNIFSIDFSALSEQEKETKIEDVKMEDSVTEDNSATISAESENISAAEKMDMTGSNDATENSVLDIESMVVEEQVVEETVTFDFPKNIGAEYVQNSGESEMRAVDALLKAAEMINDQSKLAANLPTTQDYTDANTEKSTTNETPEVDENTATESTEVSEKLPK
ncbi:KAT8 regulatory NSL complex subunit 2 [Diabrotica undecimpunctata]|uniref:KAT8 regulatory NSL complex subunit 2 n=1 Tax=Diabrotica undecimpunctata TaxID=50387 RepID=UPI003B63ABB1